MGDLKFIVTERVPISGEVSIAAVQSEIPTPANSLELTMYHHTHPGNVADSIYAYNATGVAMVGYAGVDGPRDHQIVITDKVLYSNDATRDTILLPYQYQLRYDHWEASINPSGTISICYENGEVVPDSKFRLEYSNPTMWEDYRDNGVGMTYRYDRSLPWSNVPPGTGVCRVRLVLPESLSYTNQTYYVKYNMVRKVSGGSSINVREDVTNNHLEIINPELLYEYGSDYTYNPASVSVSIVPGGLIQGSEVYMKRSEINRVAATLPEPTSREGWFLRIWAGSFRDSSNNVYYVPEATTHQPAWVDWAGIGDPIIDPRCSMISYDEAIIINPYHIRTPEHPLYFTTTNYPDYIPYGIYDGYHNPLSDVDTNTNSSRGINIYVNDVPISSGLIVDWDSWNGIIKLGSPLRFDDDVRVTYLYRQLYYTMQVPDMCPQFHHIKPEGYAGRDDSIVVALLPSGNAHYADQLVTWYHTSSNPSGIYDGTYYGYSSVMTDPLPSTAVVPLVAGTIKLAEVSVAHTVPHSTVSIYDSRTRGGGICDDNYIAVSRREEITRGEIQDESNYYADIGLYDGQGLKKDGVLVITIPMSKLVEIRSNILGDIYGISNEDAHLQAISIVRKIIESNIAIGTYYVILDENGNLWPSILPTRG